MKNKLKFQSVLDITTNWNEWVELFKQMPYKKFNALMAAMGLKNSNMFTYCNITEFQGRKMKYLVQTGQNVESESIFFLN